MSKTSIGYLEMDALSAEPSDVLASRYGFCIISGTPYYWDGSAWNEFSSGGSAVGNMNDVYENGSTVTIDSGAIVYNDATTAALNTLELNKNGAGSGNLIDLDMNLGIAAGGIYIDCGAGARTGADIKVKDDSTGTHIVFDIDSSGSGVTTGFAWTDSYNGNGGNTGVLLTLDANDGLTSTALSIVRGAGIRTTGAINIDDGSTGSGSLIDIDLTGAYTGNIIDFATSGIATGNVFNVNLDTAVAMTAIHLEGSGVRTEAFIEVASDATGASNMATFTPSGATWSGHVLQFLMTAATTGDVLNIDMNAAVGGKAIYIDSGASTRTAVLIDILADGDGDVDVFNIDESNDGSGNVFDINVSGIGSGNVVDITYSAADTGDALKVVMADNVAGGALVITGAGTRTDSIIDVLSAEDGSVDGMVYFGTSGVFTGNILTLHSDGAATTGSLLHFDLDAGVAYKAITFDQAGARTSAVMLATFDGTFASGGGGTFLDANISMTGASASSFIDIDVSAIYTGDIIDIALGAASTGTVMDVDMNLGVAARFLTLDAGSVTRTVPMMVFTFDGAGDTVGGTLMDINVTNTGATASPLFDIDVTAIYTGNIIDIVFGNASASTGDALHVDMGTNLAGNAIQIDAAGARTAPLIYVANTGTDAGTDDHLMFLYQTGALDSNMVQLTYATAASTGNALSIAMDTNVAGMALDITSSGTGVTGEGSAINVTHDGVLVAGADIVSIAASGAISSTSNALSIATIGDAGSYALYINATGSAEGIHVDAGTVLIDETLTVTGTTTLGALVYTSLNDGTSTMTSTSLELTRVADLSARLVDAGATETATLAAHSDRIILLDTAAGSVVTLPAAAGTGAVIRVVVSVLATSNSHIVKVANGSDVLDGQILLVDQDTAGTVTGFVTAATSDTVTLNRSTTGSVTIGEWVEFVDIATNQWAVRGVLTNTGSGATPFSATVA